MSAVAFTHIKVLRNLLCGATLLTFAGGMNSLHAQTGPFAPTNWPTTVNASATVDYGIFDPNASFTTPAGWN
jgi:hypothetical protein